MCLCIRSCVWLLSCCLLLLLLFGVLYLVVFCLVSVCVFFGWLCLLFVVCVLFVLSFVCGACCCCPFFLGGGGIGLIVYFAVFLSYVVLFCFICFCLLLIVCLCALFCYLFVLYCCSCFGCCFVFVFCFSPLFRSFVLSFVCLICLVVFVPPPPVCFLREGVAVVCFVFLLLLFDVWFVCVCVAVFLCVSLCFFV